MAPEIVARDIFPVCFGWLVWDAWDDHTEQGLSTERYHSLDTRASAVHLEGTSRT